ncbi:2-hydroxy-3-oxopropionate reductase, partial [Mesorhizobium sp. M00.F.Ca.ET.149.01.1.1]
NGGAKEDHSALVRALERMANFEVGGDAAETKGKAA